MAEQTFNIGDPRDVQPWDIIQNELCKEFDSDEIIFQEVLKTSTKILGDDWNSDAKIKNANDYFESLHTILAGRQEDIVDFCITLFSPEHVTLYIDMGCTAMRDVLYSYKEKVVAYRRKLLELGSDQDDKNFVGREKLVDEIVDFFTCGGKRAYCIYGMGGIGKTALALNVCRKMDGRWEKCVVSFREIQTFIPALRAILLGLQRGVGDEPFVRIQDGPKEAKRLEEELYNFVKHKIKRDTLLLLDNTEDLTANKSQHTRFLEFLKVFIDRMTEENDKLRLLITTRHKLVEDGSFLSLFSPKTKPTKGDLEEKELSSLKTEDAVKLLRMCLPSEDSINDRTCDDIVEACGRNPMAIKSLCFTLRNSKEKREEVLEKLKLGSRAVRIGEIKCITQCLKRSLDFLDEELRKQFFMLSVFRTFPFTVEDAQFVLGLTDGARTSDTESVLFSLKLRHLIEHQTQQHKYSLHPLMFQVVKGLEKSTDVSVKNGLKTAKKRYMTLSCDLTCKVSKRLDTNCLGACSLLDKNRLQIMNFFEEVPEASFTCNEDKDEAGRVINGKLLSELADLLVLDKLKWKLLLKWKADAKTELEEFYWRSEEAYKYLDQDRKHEAKLIIENVEPLLAQKKGDENVQNAVRGSFYFMKGRYLILTEDCHDAERSCQVALNYFRRLKETPFWKYYKTVFASTLNSLGSAHYRMKVADIEKALEYHTCAYNTVTHTKKDNKNNNLLQSLFLTNIGTCYHKQADALRQLGHIDEADVKDREAIQLYDEALYRDQLMKLDTLNGYAHKLLHRGNAWMALRIYKKAEEDLMMSLLLRAEILPKPHIDLTVTLHKLGEVLYRKGVWMSCNNEKDKGLESMVVAEQLYCITQNMIGKGGMSLHHKEYPRIKGIHLRILEVTKQTKKLKKIRKSYESLERWDFTGFKNKLADQLEKGRRATETVKRLFWSSKKVSNEPEHMECSPSDAKPIEKQGATGISTLSSLNDSDNDDVDDKEELCLEPDQTFDYKQAQDVENTAEHSKTTIPPYEFDQDELNVEFSSHEQDKWSLQEINDRVCLHWRQNVQLFQTAASYVQQNIREDDDIVQEVKFNDLERAILEEKDKRSNYAFASGQSDAQKILALQNEKEIEKLLSGHPVYTRKSQMEPSHNPPESKTPSKRKFDQEHAQCQGNWIDVIFLALMVLCFILFWILLSLFCWFIYDTLINVVFL